MKLCCQNGVAEIIFWLQNHLIGNSYFSLLLGNILLRHFIMFLVLIAMQMVYHLQEQILQKTEKLGERIPGTTTQ